MRTNCVTDFSVKKNIQNPDFFLENQQIPLNENLQESQSTTAVQVLVNCFNKLTV